MPKNERRKWYRIARKVSGYTGLLAMAAGMFYLTLHSFRPNQSWPLGVTATDALILIITGLSLYLISARRLEERVEELEDKINK